MILWLAALLACRRGPETEVAASREALAATVFETPASVLPESTAGAAPEIAPVQPGELSAPATDGGPGLRVLLVGPQGRQEAPRQAMVVFDRPMVALDQLDAMAEKVPLACAAEGGGSLAGRTRWAGTSTAVWIPDGARFPKATAVNCHVPAGISATDGTALAERVAFAFETGRPRLVQTEPYDGSDEWDPKRAMLLVFDQPVAVEQVGEHLVLTDESGRAVKTTLRRPAVRAPEDDPDEVDGSPKVGAGEVERAVLIEAKLERDMEYRLALRAGLRGTEGPLGTEAELALSFRTIPPARILDFEPRGTNVNPYTTLRLDLATVTDAAELGPHIQVEPAPPDGWNPASAYAWRDWSYGVRLQPMTTYTITVTPGATDRYGQTYDQPLRWSFTTGHAPALIDAAAGPQVYPATNPPALPIRSRNLQTLRAYLTRVSAEELIASWQNRAYKPHPRAMTDAAVVYGDGKPTDRIRVDLLDLTPHLRGGHGFVSVDTWSPEYRQNWGNHEIRVDHALLQVTNLGTTFKVSPEGTTTWVTTLSEGRPVAGAEVRIYLGTKQVWTGSTDAAGLAQSPRLTPPDWRPWETPLWALVRKGDDEALTAATSPYELATWSFDLHQSDVVEAGELRTHAYTDRGVYRPGDTVHLALTARVADGKGLSIPAETAVHWSCQDARGLDLGQGEGRLSARGSFNWDLALPAEAALGYGGCAVELEGAFDGQAQIDIPVYAYRAPTFRVDVSAPEQAIAGQALKVTGHGRYLFGAPMAGAEQSWSVRRVEVDPAPAGWEAFSFRAPGAAALWEVEHRSEQAVASGEGKLGKDGQIPIEVALPLTEEPRTWDYTTELTVVDVARQRISNRATTRVAPAGLYVGLRPLKSLGEAGKPVGFEFVAVTPEGQAQAGVPVELTIVRRSWDSIRQKGLDGRWTWVSTHKDVVVEQRTVSSAAGATAFSFTPAEGGWYAVTARARDGQNRPTASEDGLYVAGAGVAWARSDDNTVELVPDKQRYQPGDTARILVKAPRAGLTGLVTVEREGILDRKVRTFDSAAEILEIPLGEDAVPNVYVGVLLVEGAPPATSPDAGMPAYFLGYTELTVDPSGRRLEVAISTDRQSYQPGDNVAVTVSVQRKQGTRTVPAEGAHVVLYAVDYGVLTLTGYQTPDAFDGYYEPHGLRVETSDNRTRILDRGHFLAKGAEAGGGGGMADRTRSQFVTTPLWDPNLSTNREGRLIRRFKLPDNLTTFQLMAVVDHGNGGFGSADHQVRVSLPLIAQPALPRLLRTGDRALAGIVVHNNREITRTVEVSAEASGLTLTGSPTRVEVPAGGAVEVPFALTEPQAGEASFRFRVRAGADHDAVEHRIPVLRPVPTEVVASAGLADPTAGETIARPAGALAGVGGLEIEVSPTVLIGAEQSLRYLLDYPHGCLEQTTSRLTIAILARELGERIALTLTPQELDERIQAGLGRLPEFRTPSGGLATWPGSREPSALGTAAAVEALHRAGQPIPDENLSFLRAFLGGQWHPSWWDRATARAAEVRVALALARIGQPDAGFNARLYDDRGILPLSGRARLLEALGRATGPDARTLEILRDLGGSVAVEGTVARLRDQNTSSALWDGEAAASAAATSALLQVQPDHPLLPRLARGLVDARLGGFWGNTWTTLQSFRALADYAARFEAAGLPSGATGTLAGKPLFHLTFQGPRAAAHSIPIDAMEGGDLRIEGTGGTVYYETRLRYAQERMPARDEGFSLSRTYTLLEGTGLAGQVTAGALVRVDLRVVTPFDRYNVALVDPLPAGLEPVDTFFKTTASAYADEETADTGWSGEDQELPTWSSWIWSHRELRDDGLRLYADTMPAGIHTWQYLARATSPGDYALPAATIEEMYRPEVYGRTEAGRLVVGAGPVATR